MCIWDWKKRGEEKIEKKKGKEGEVAEECNGMSVERTTKKLLNVVFV